MSHYIPRKEKKPIIEEPFTQLPHHFTDTLMPRITLLSELKVALLVIRQTIGFQRQWHKLSLRAFQHGTGLSIQACLDGIEAALCSGVITRRSKGNGYEYCYEHRATPRALHKKRHALALRAGPQSTEQSETGTLSDGAPALHCVDSIPPQNRAQSLYSSQSIKEKHRKHLCLKKEKETAKVLASEQLPSDPFDDIYDGPDPFADVEIESESAATVPSPLVSSNAAITGLQSRATPENGSDDGIYPSDDDVADWPLEDDPFASDEEHEKMSVRPHVAGTLSNDRPEASANLRAFRDTNLGTPTPVSKEDLLAHYCDIQAIATDAGLNLDELPKGEQSAILEMIQTAVRNGDLSFLLNPGRFRVLKALCPCSKRSATNSGTATYADVRWTECR